MKDLAPEIYRQRLTIEATKETPFTSDEIVEYLNLLCEKLNMVALNEPVTHLSETYGWSAWMHWETSGVHFYSWDKREPVFFSVDIYTCKEFDVDDALSFTKEHLNTIELLSKETNITD